MGEGEEEEEGEKKESSRRKGEKWKGLIYTQITLLSCLGNLVCCVNQVIHGTHCDSDEYVVDQ